jgi:tetratricopeptide (TPR) repeat protein
LEEAYKLGDTSILTLDDLVVAYAIQGDYTHDVELYKKALDISQKVISLSPQDASVYLNRALIYEQLNSRKDVVANLEQFLRLEQDPGWQKEAREMLR